MIQQSKLASAKLKMSKLKEKYLNSSKFNKKDDNESIQTTEYKSETGNNLVNLKNNSLVPAVEKTFSPSIIKNTEDTTTVEEKINNEDEKQGLSKPNKECLDSLNLIDQVILSPLSFGSENSNKTTNRSLKSDSIILSELSNQFEQICFLSSTSDEESIPNPASFSTHPISRSIHKNPDNLLFRIPIPSLNEQYPKKQDSSSEKGSVGLNSPELSEVQSDLTSTISSEIKGDKDNSTESKKLIIHDKEDLESLPEKDERSDDDTENGYEISTGNDEKHKASFISKQSLKLEQLDQTKVNDFVESSENVNTISKSEEQNISSPLTENSLIKQRQRKCKTSKLSIVTEGKLKINRNNSNITKIASGSKDKHERYVDRYINDDDIHAKVKPKSQHLRQRYSNKSKTLPNQSTNFKHSRNRPVLKSCVLFKTDKTIEEDKHFLSKSLSPFKHESLQNDVLGNLRDCGCEEVIVELLRTQVELTRHYIHSHHQMYLLCCQAVAMLSNKHHQ